MLKAPGTERLTLKHDDLLSSFALKFNLRRYIKAIEVTDFQVDANVFVHTGATPAYAVAGSLKASASVGGAGWPYQTHLESAWNLALETSI
jgi:hypothetical protein